MVLSDVDSPADHLTFETAANVTLIWAYRNCIAPGASDALQKAVATLRRPPGEYYAWVACESLIAKALRRQPIADHAVNPKWMRAAGYWRRGAIAVHETHED